MTTIREARHLPAHAYRAIHFHPSPGNSLQKLFVRSPTKTMSFPYGDTKGWLGIGCDGESEWVYAGFTNDPNLQGTEIGDGYNSITTRIKFDDEIETVNLTQTWNSKFLHFRNDKDIIDKIMKANTILLELKWYSEGSVYFRFSGGGSTSAINQIRASCQ